MHNVKTVKLIDGQYDLTLEDGQRLTVRAITTEGKARKNDQYFDHEVRFSDGTVQRHVVSMRILTIPDYPLLQS